MRGDEIDSDDLDLDEDGIDKNNLRDNIHVL